MMHARRAFSLVELLVVIAVIALLTGLLLPGLSASRESARHTACTSRLRQLITAWTMYADSHKERVMPLAYWSAADIGSGPQVFWWGTHGDSTTPPDHARGFIAPFLDAGLARGSVFECPSQPWGSYRAQGPSRSPTSTYGYNGYYLSPAKTPGWGETIGFRPWRRLHDIARPDAVFTFADAMLAGSQLRNSALLDPPMLYSSGVWQHNQFPTTSFRHHRRTAAASADGSVRSHHAITENLTQPAQQVGSVTAGNDPHYVPDWQDWP